MTVGGRIRKPRLQGNFVKFLIQEYSPVVLRMLKQHSRYGHYCDARSLTVWQFEREFERLGHVMARRTSKKLPSTGSGSKVPEIPIEWVNYRLAPEDAAVVVSECEQPKKIADGVTRLLHTGCDFSIRFNPERGNWSAFSIAPYREGMRSRIGISAFGADLWQAASALLFKLRVFEQSPGKFSSGGGGLGVG